MRDFNMPPDISKADFLNTLEHLKDDANDESTRYARLFTRFGDPENKAKAMFYFGQVDLLVKFIWALSGTAEDEGVAPIIQISDISGDE